MIWGKLEVLETFRALIWVLAKTTRKTLWWTLRSRGLTFTRNATEAFKNSRFTNMEKGLWARPLLNHIFVVSLVFLCIPWHKFTALIFLWKFFFFFFISSHACLYGLPENKKASWESGPWCMAALACSVHCSSTHTRLTVFHWSLYFSTIENY